MFKESNIYSPEIAKAGSQNDRNGGRRISQNSNIYSLGSTSLQFFNISNQIHSMYQLIKVHIPSGVDNIGKNMAAFSGT